ncbi:MAG: hypothetical protein DRP79_01190 [Planctomycetota bacterium]|nr:MAG: hypothetical protein DRP79_01190 [Planctomycetota bacterium]
MEDEKLYSGHKPVVGFLQSKGYWCDCENLKLLHKCIEEVDEASVKLLQYTDELVIKGERNETGEIKFDEVFELLFYQWCCLREKYYDHWSALVQKGMIKACDTNEESEERLSRLDDEMGSKVFSLTFGKCYWVCEACKSEGREVIIPFMADSKFPLQLKWSVMDDFREQILGKHDEEQSE